MLDPLNWKISEKIKNRRVVKCVIKVLLQSLRMLYALIFWLNDQSVIFPMASFAKAIGKNRVLLRIRYVTFFLLLLQLPFSPSFYLFYQLPRICCLSVRIFKGSRTSKGAVYSLFIPAWVSTRDCKRNPDTTVTSYTLRVMRAKYRTFKRLPRRLAGVPFERRDRPPVK